VPGGGPGFYRRGMVDFGGTFAGLRPEISIVNVGGNFIGAGETGGVGAQGRGKAAGVGGFGGGAVIFFLRGLFGREGQRGASSSRTFCEKKGEEQNPGNCPPQIFFRAGLGLVFWGKKPGGEGAGRRC